MADKENYKSYTTADTYETTRRDFFCDQSGIPNAKAFEDFSNNIDFDEEYVLICLNIDLRATNNKEGYASGSRIMRKFYLALDDMGVFAFRMGGEKFNVLCKKDKLQDLIAFLDKDNSEKYSIYYGSPKEPYNIFTSEDLIEEGKTLMYADKHKKVGKKEFLANDKLVGNKGNTPADLQETAVHKYRTTMWYSKVKITFINQFREINVYIFVTDFRNNYESLPLVVVLDDLIEYKAFYGNNIVFKEEGIEFTINARFDRQGRMQTAVFADREKAAEVKLEFTEKHEGICIPATFGKRIGDKEVYPIKQNVNGTCDYVLLDKDKVTIDRTGLITVNDTTYGVYMDAENIDLVKQ